MPSKRRSRSVRSKGRSKSVRKGIRMKSIRKHARKSRRVRFMKPFDFLRDAIKRAKVRR